MNMSKVTSDTCGTITQYIHKTSITYVIKNDVPVSQLHSEETVPCIIERIIFTRCQQTVHKCKGEFEL